MLKLNENDAFFAKSAAAENISAMALHKNKENYH